MLVHQLPFQNSISAKLSFTANCNLSTRPISDAHSSLLNMDVYKNAERKLGREDNNQDVINNFDGLDEIYLLYQGNV